MTKTRNALPTSTSPTTSTVLLYRRSLLPIPPASLTPPALLRKKVVVAPLPSPLPLKPCLLYMGKESDAHSSVTGLELETHKEIKAIIYLFLCCSEEFIKLNACHQISGLMTPARDIPCQQCQSNIENIVIVIVNILLSRITISNLEFSISDRTYEATPNIY